MKIPESPYPKDFVPRDAQVVVGYDKGKGDDCGCEVKGFYLDGVFHVQEIVHHERVKGDDNQST